MMGKHMKFPKEIVRTVIIAEVTLCEVPQLVELALVAREGSDIHSIAHAFGADVVMADIDDIAHVLGCAEANPFVNRIAFEELAIGVLYKLSCKTGAVAGLDKHIARCISLHGVPSFESPNTTLF